MKKQLALALLLATASSAAAAADGLSHSYVEAGFVRHQAELPVVEGQGVSVDDMKADGGYIAGSFEVMESVYLFGGYHKGNDDVGVSLDGIGEIGEFDADVQQGHIGLGYHHKLSDRVEWTGELSYLNTRLELKVEDFKERLKGDDYRASVGLRGDLAANFEGWIKANYTDGDVYDGEFSGTLGALVKFNKTWGIVGEAEVGSDDRQFRLGVRASF
ncbi:hypothetical protein [Lysobacter gummosus]|jgi:opacity protein-like surface antigen|uniref:Outer membrane beta-barrel domain protein n=1 Tax=Lysobacter gummosus TaxID=262324 RepID=A0ABY3XGZ8_9GAMM|nr:hypothetical protein [Lysobacter gummosus]ALN90364.1 outer membrane beta-barrel domain protein [Lysobacter gummosus]UNP30894.1 hypothetical protein MOV92_06490 [Lysobacter gummosus]